MNDKTNDLINIWIKTGNKKLVKKILKEMSAKDFYKKCKEMYRITNDIFYIRSMKKISPYYFVKANLFYNKYQKELERKKEIISQKTKRINDILKTISSPEKSVYIMQGSFYDHTGENYFSGGGERYACDLANLIKKMGYNPILLQKGIDDANEPWVRNFKDLTVIGINSEYSGYYEIVNGVDSPKLTVYSGCIDWKTENAHHPSILISHGITWDHPFSDANVEYLKRNLNIADTFVSVDTSTISWFRSTFSKTIMTNGIQMEYVPNYVDLENYHPNDNKDKNKPIKVLFPRRCSNERGFWLFTDVIPKIFENFQNIEIDMVGFAHTEEIQNRIKLLSKNYPNRFKHYVANADEMPEIYRKADISVIPTLYSEGTSLSCIEAMATGNAVVSTNIGGLPNLILNGYNGLLIDTNYDSLYEAISALIMNEKYRIDISKNAQKVAQAFSKTNWENSWTKILNNYLSSQNNKEEKNTQNSELKNKYLNKILENIDTNKKQRLFVSTGFISLINAMSIIEDDSSEFENHLIIYTSRTSDIFKNANKKLVLDNIFKTVNFADDLSFDENIKFIEDERFLKSFNEIYTTAQNSYDIWNKHNCINLIEEGISSYFSFENINYSNIKNIYLSNYFNKIFYLDKSQENKVRILDKNLIKNIINKIKLQNDLNFKEFQSENLVLFLSQYIYQDFMSNEEVTNFYIKHIDTLINNNYTVLFKSHPRVNDVITENLAKYYKNNPKFKFFDAKIKYPVELMIEDLNLKAIVTSMSGGAINCSHLFDIPCYGIGAKLIKDNHPFENVRRYADVFINNIEHLKELNRIENDLAKNK